MLVSCTTGHFFLKFYKNITPFFEVSEILLILSHVWVAFSPLHPEVNDVYVTD